MLYQPRDLPRHEREIRKVWGGPLCLTTAKHSQAELRKISAQLGDLLPHLYTAGTDVVRIAASARILLATKDIQRDMDRRFGPGVVHLEGVMHPIGEAA